MPMRHLAFMFIALAGAQPALARDECYGTNLGYEGSESIRLAIVTAKKAAFHDGQEKATSSYVLEGDEVIAFETLEGFICAAYISKKGVYTSGWLKKEQVTLRDIAPPKLDVWLGDWNSSKWQNLTLGKGKKPGWIHVSGEAYWAMSEENAQNGALHEGSVDGEGPLQNGQVGFTQTTDETYRPWSAAAKDNYECAILVKVLSNNYLMAQDSSNCGGHNVRFDGYYARGKVKFE